MDIDKYGKTISQSQKSPPASTTGNAPCTDAESPPVADAESAGDE
jgi:hypothetical protein